jgi:hypothetical protein
LIFGPKIALRTECSDTAQNPNFRADFLNARYSVVSFSATEEILNRYMGERGGERGLEKAQTIGLNCGVTHSRGKIEYKCCFFLMTFRKQIHKKNSVKMISILYRVL